jgi:hypothetical protein
MIPGTYFERLKTEKDEVSESTHIVREEIDRPMWVIMVLEDGHEVRFEHKEDHVSISTPTGVINIRPIQSNAIEIGVPPLGSPPKGTSHASL